MNILSSYLKQSGIRQSDFADAVGVGQAMVSKLARGFARPSLELALAIERASRGEVPVSSWVHPASHANGPAENQGGAA